MLRSRALTGRGFEKSHLASTRKIRMIKNFLMTLALATFATAYMPTVLADTTAPSDQTMQAPADTQVPANTQAEPSQDDKATLDDATPDTADGDDDY
jgi:hypothetical protein